MFSSVFKQRLNNVCSKNNPLVAIERSDLLKISFKTRKTDKQVYIYMYIYCNKFYNLILI